MPPHIQGRIADEFAAAKKADDPWGHLERAHILAQPWIRPHVRTHAAMLIHAIRERSRREIAGQLVRLVVAGPGSATGRYPTGNTGRANVPMTKLMPIPPSLQQILDQQ